MFAVAKNELRKRTVAEGKHDFNAGWKKSEKFPYGIVHAIFNTPQHTHAHT